ncbi:Small subunit (SSU) processome component [Fusarium torreyae]|uniref:Small subunit (SSU) processome component n=1 Tax=Fusarium torreyae TaxID=1237075 RepID=A0A9W8VHN0_9HYPO|nr:Small subunit (SSU) processome component [Fusarium torreyae]
MSTKRKAPVKLATPVSRTSARIPNKSIIDESKASIAGPEALQSSNVETIEISSDADSDEDISDAESPEEQQPAQENAAAITARSKTAKQKTNGQSNDEDSDAEATSPSFGELLRAENDIIDVPSALNGAVVTQPAQNTIAPPTHQSLTTVLSQALRTDDTDLLESCLHTTDLPTIRNTIERLDSALAGILLTKLAARLYRRPGRAGNLMTWVQWTLVAHGGALASQPKVIHSLSGLQKVLAERAKGLSSLLSLKGKLDMLEGQMDLRRKMSRGAGLHTGGDSDSESDEDEDVIWVEGEDDAARTPGRRRGLDTDFDDSDDDADVPITNGFVGDSDDEEDVSAGEEDESDAEESLDEDEVNHDDVDESMGEDEESDVEAAAAPPSKLQKTAGSFGKRR